MRRRLWAVALCLYAIAGIADGVYRLAEARHAATVPLGSVLVAFCAALFWPLDIAVRLVLGPG